MIPFDSIPTTVWHFPMPVAEAATLASTTLLIPETWSDTVTAMVQPLSGGSSNKPGPGSGGHIHIRTFHHSNSAMV